MQLHSPGSSTKSSGEHSSGMFVPSLALSAGCILPLDPLLLSETSLGVLKRSTPACCAAAAAACRSPHDAPLARGGASDAERALPKCRLCTLLLCCSPCWRAGAHPCPAGDGWSFAFIPTQGSNCSGREDLQLYSSLEWHIVFIFMPKPQSGAFSQVSWLPPSASLILADGHTVCMIVYANKFPT